MKKILIALATTVALVGPAAAEVQMPTFAVGDWCAGPSGQTKGYSWPGINWKDWPSLMFYERHEAVGDEHCRDQLVVTADKFIFSPDDVEVEGEGDVTCRPLAVRELKFSRDSRDRGAPSGMWFIKTRCGDYVFIDYKGSLVMLAKTSAAFNSTPNGAYTYD